MTFIATPKTKCRPDPTRPKRPRRSRIWIAQCLALTLYCIVAGTLSAQTATGPQQLAFAGLRGAGGQGQFNAVKTDASGNLYILLDEKDGVRLLKTDPTATNVLAQAHLGASGDIGLSLALDLAGNTYVAGTTYSQSLTGTPGAAFPNRADSSVNSFIAKFDGSLNLVFVTFAGSGHLAATSITATPDAVFLTGLLFASTLPVTPGAIEQAPAPGSSENGFVERFSADGNTLVYATYLTGASGNTAPSSIAADPSDNVYVAGYTSAPGFPVIAALVPRIPSANSLGSGFLTRLTPAADAITFSTFIPGSGITSLAYDPSVQNLLLSGTIDMGLFPVAVVQSPVVATPYQVLLSVSLDGSKVLNSTLLAPGTQSFVTPAGGGAAWVDGPLSTTLLPLAPLAAEGSAFAIHATAQGIVDQTARFGARPTTDPNYSAASVNLTSLAADPSGNPILAGAFVPTTSADLLLTETYDLPLSNAPTTVLPSAVTDAAQPATVCNGSSCGGSAGYLAKLIAGSDAPSLALSIGAAPDLLLRNLGSAMATRLQFTVTGFTAATTCTDTIAAGAECAIALTGSGPGSITVSAANATAQTSVLPALSAAPTPLAFSPRELDFGVQTAASAPILRSLTVTNLSETTQTFTPDLDAGVSQVASPFSLVTTDCASSTGVNVKILAAGASCHITFSFALTSTTPDGPTQANWTIAASGNHDVLLTGYAHSAALSTSTTEIGFGTQFSGGLRSPRFLYLSNHSDSPVTHTPVALESSAPFKVIDICPSTLVAHSVCQLQLTYESPVSPSDDSSTLSLDQGISVLVTGQTLPQPGVNDNPVNPSLTVSTSAITFSDPVPVTGTSATTQIVTLGNTGTTPFSLSFNLSGDFTSITSCGPTLGPANTCAVVLTFTPNAPGSRHGLLTITAGAGTAPTYVTLSGTATAILPASNGTLDLGSTPVGEPIVQWFKISQPFHNLTLSTTGDFAAILVEDIGLGHGNPAPSSFRTALSGSCLNCFLGIQFTPTASHARTGSIGLTSARQAPYMVTLIGNGLPQTGLLVSPAAQDFGPVPLHSTSQTLIFALTNVVTSTSTSITLTPPTTTGDFAISQSPTGGSPCTGTLALYASCLVPVTFSPTATGPRVGTLTFETSSGTVTSTLSGFGNPDPGISLAPTALTFQNVPGITASRQTITLTNTSLSTIQIGPLSTDSSPFAVSSLCATLAPAATCTAAVIYTPTSAPTSGTLSIPVTSLIGGSPVLTDYTVHLTGAYTSAGASLQIVPTQLDFGSAPTSTIGSTRTFTLNNLTAQTLSPTISLPRQFALSTLDSCLTLPPYTGCTFSATYLPLTASNVTGSILASAQTQASATPISAIAYLQAYGAPPSDASLSITGPLSPGTGVLDFGQVVSGQSLSQTLTLTNTSSSAQTITLRRITTQPPFLSTSTCGLTLQPRQGCTVTITYSPLDQVVSSSSGSTALSNAGILMLESDAPSSPDIVNLTGSAAPVSVATPVNNSPIAAFTLSQAALTFPLTRGGNASPVQTVTLTNTGTLPFHLDSLRTPPAFTVTSVCPSALAPAAACILSVSFTPQIAGVYTGALEILSDSATSLDFITLYATATDASILLSPRTLDFGTLNVGTTSVLPVQVTNDGSVPVVFTSISTPTGDFSASGDCPAPGSPLAIATSCTIQVAFAPTIPGTRAATLAVSTSASSLPLTVSLTGIGTQSDLRLVPSALAFNPIVVGASATLSLTLSNAGTAPVSRLAFTIAGDYAVTTPCALTTLAPNQSCTMSVTFTPSATGPRAGTLTLISSDPASPNVIPLTGTGISNGTFTLTVDGSTTSSASVRSGSPALYTLTVTPAGSFNGNVVLNCTPITPALYASCSILPSSISLAGFPQNAALTVNTVTSIQVASTRSRPWTSTTLCLLAPGLFLLWRTRRHRTHFARLAGVVLCTVAAFAAIACGGGPNPNLRYALPGTYQFQIAASSTSGIQIVQIVTVSTIVQD